MVKRTLFLIWMVSTLISPAVAEVKIVATLPWIGSIAREIGKDRVNIAVLVKPNQDAHYMEAKPGMVLAASKADITLSYKLDLPTAPLIVASLSVAFFILLLFRIGRMQRIESLMNAEPSKTQGENGR